MTQAFEIKIKGMAELQKALYQYNKKMGDRVTQLALRKAGNYYKSQLRAAAPMKTGTLRRAIVLRTSKIHKAQKDGMVGVYVTILKGKKYNTSLNEKAKTHRDAYYASWVESGYNHRSRRIGYKEAVKLGLTSIDAIQAEHIRRANKGLKRKRFVFRADGKPVPGKHFVLNTFRATKTTAIELIISSSEAALKQLAQQLNLKVS